MKPHKHAELIKAWADGAEIQYKWQGEWFDWKLETSPEWNEEWKYRIKPPQWQEDLRQAVRDGKTIEIKHGDWMWSSINENVDTYLFGVFTEDRYRIKPEPKPDVASYFRSENYQLFFTIHHKEASLKVKWDGETGKLKSSEVLK